VAAGFSPEAFGKYFLVDKIATGGMAEIFKAKSYSHAGFEKLLVIKRILQHHSENEDFVKMFIDEAKISVQLQHPNIVHIYDFGKLHSNCYIAMECVDGKDVKQILRKLAERRKYLPEEYAVFIAHDALAGLDYAHNKTNLKGEAQNIVHRDMSPSNLLVSYEGDVKVADFGIAKAEHRAYSTQDGVLKGKFEYMSPEQARGKANHCSTDVFSTGIILWEMLTGRRMFKTDNDLATLEKIKSGGYPPPSVLNPHISARLDGIVMKALAVNRADRYPNALAFENALAAYLAPNTPSTVKRSMADFLQELFAEERGQRNRK
jgi:serine/threonine protein kinase